MKTKIMNSSVGRTLLSVRRNWELRSLSTKNPEKAGIIANAIIADKLISQICPKGGTFLDIGAQFGAIFSLAYSFDQSLQVYAFEAESTKANGLKTAYPYAKVYDVAIGEKEGEAIFYLNPNASGYNSLVPGDDRQEVRVRVAAIDELLPEVNADVLKIDVEGAELGALIGAKMAIQRNNPTIMFECVLPSENSLGYSAEKIWDWFSINGYGIFTPDRVAHDAPPLGREAFSDAQQYPFRSHNYFAISSARRLEIRDKARSILNVG